MVNRSTNLVLIVAITLGTTALVSSSASARTIKNTSAHSASAPTAQSSASRPANFRSFAGSRSSNRSNATGNSKSNTSMTRKRSGSAVTHNQDPVKQGPLGNQSNQSPAILHQAKKPTNCSNDGQPGCLGGPGPGIKVNPQGPTPPSQTNQGGPGSNQVNQTGTGNVTNQTNQTVNETNNFGGGGGGGGGISLGGGFAVDPGPAYVAPVAPEVSRRQVAAPPRLTAPPVACFHRDYAPDGSLLLVDDCTRQQVTVLLGGNSCLQTQDAQAGSVWFADMCVKQQVLAPPAASMEALALIYKKTPAVQ
jgi:hypothetical protein